MLGMAQVYGSAANIMLKEQRQMLRTLPEKNMCSDVNTEDAMCYNQAARQ